MKHLKQYFNMVITAVICFFMGLIPEKGELIKSVKVRRSGGQAVGLMTWVSPGCKDSACSTHRKYALEMDRHKDKWKPAEASEHKRLPCMSQLICRGSPFLSGQDSLRRVGRYRWKRSATGNPAMQEI